MTLIKFPCPAEKGKEERIWRGFGKDLEYISRGKRKYFLSSTSRNKNKLEGKDL